MKRVLFLALIATSAIAKINPNQFVTPQDLHSTFNSNITLRNSTNTNQTVYGLYVRQYGLVTPGQSCSSQTIIYPASNNITAGAMVMPVAINAGKSAVIGANYLYNLIYGAIYYERIIIPSSPPGCALPGCTWGSDATQYNWCVYLGALTPISGTSDYTSNVPPATDNASSTGNYNYNLISSYTTIGPISCNDQTLTCTDTQSQTQSF